MEENSTQKFMERLKELVKLSKKKKGILELQEINDFFHDMELSPEQMEHVFDYLESNNVDVLRISPGQETDVDLELDLGLDLDAIDMDIDAAILAEEEEVDVENIDLSVPDDSYWLHPVNTRDRLTKFSFATEEIYAYALERMREKKD